VAELILKTSQARAKQVTPSSFDPPALIDEG
jgi:hypothetical protein